MVPDIFYPILTLKITVLAFYTKKSGASPPPEHHPGPPGGLTAPPPPPPPIPPAAKKNDAPIFFVDYPLVSLCFAHTEKWQLR